MCESRRSENAEMPQRRRRRRLTDDVEGADQNERDDVLNVVQMIPVAAEIFDVAHINLTKTASNTMCRTCVSMNQTAFLEPFCKFLGLYCVADGHIDCYC